VDRGVWKGKSDLLRVAVRQNPVDSTRSSVPIILPPHTPGTYDDDDDDDDNDGTHNKQKQAKQINSGRPAHMSFGWRGEKVSVGLASHPYAHTPTTGRTAAASASTPNNRHLFINLAALLHSSHLLTTFPSPISPTHKAQECQSRAAAAAAATSAKRQRWPSVLLPKERRPQKHMHVASARRRKPRRGRRPGCEMMREQKKRME